MAPKRKRASHSSAKKKKKDDDDETPTTETTETSVGEDFDVESKNIAPSEKAPEKIEEVSEVPKKSEEISETPIVPPTPNNDDGSATKKRKMSPTSEGIDSTNSLPPTRRKIEFSLTNRTPRKIISSPAIKQILPDSLANKVPDKSKVTCYLCQIQKQKSGAPEPLPLIDPTERKLDHYMDDFYHKHTALSGEASSNRSLSDLTFSAMISNKLSEANELKGDDVLKFEKKSDVISGLPPSLIIRLLPSHFTLETTNKSDDTNKTPKQIMLKYNDATKTFLSQIANCKLTPDLLEEIRDLNCTFYDGSIVVHVIDSRTNSDSLTNILKNSQPTQEILLKPEPNNLEKDINEFIDENMAEDEFTLQERLQIVQTILHTVKNDHSEIRKSNTAICLDSTPEVSKIANAIHYNRTKHLFRRRTRPKVNFYNHSQRHNANAMQTSADSLPSALQNGVTSQKQEHHLLNFIVKSKSWTESILSRKEKAVALHFPNNGAGKKKKQKPSTKQKKNKQNDTFPRNQQSETVPTEYVKLNETSLVNNKPPNRCRILKFESYDRSKSWRIDIIPHLEAGGDGKKFEAFILPPHTTAANSQVPVFSAEQPSSCVIGGRHAAELYARRLKDMFTSNGKTKIIMDTEIDMQSYIQDNRLTKPPLLLQRLSKLSHPALQGMKQNAPVSMPAIPNGTPGSAQTPQVAQPSNFVNPAQGSATNTQTTGTPSQPNTATPMQGMMSNPINPMMKPIITTIGGNPAINPQMIANQVSQRTGAPINPSAATGQLAGNLTAGIPNSFNMGYSPNMQLHFLNSMISNQGMGNMRYTVNPNNFNYLLAPNAGMNLFAGAQRQPNSTTPNIQLNPGTSNTGNQPSK